MTLVVMAGLFIALFTLSSPESIIARLASYLPFTSPLVMPTRVIVEHPALWEVGASLGLLALSVVLMVRFAARVYRVGVLLYRERVSLRRLWQLSTRSATVRDRRQRA